VIFSLFCEFIRIEILNILLKNNNYSLPRQGDGDTIGETADSAAFSQAS
jgi:hypothetical protein